MIDILSGIGIALVVLLLFIVIVSRLFESSRPSKDDDPHNLWDHY